MTRRLALLLTAGAAFWAVVILAVPLARAAAVQIPRVAVYAVGSVVCHQRPERSFHLGGTQLPVCARCLGLYLSGAVGAVLGWLGAPLAPRRTRDLVFAAALPTALTVAVEWAGLALPGNVLRAAAALPLGGAAGWLFVRMLRQESSATTCATIA